ncbi:MAG TPA: hypothetical protein VM802_05730 [Chitinophaga sp.]|uniref:hypothetical protein n=1 Tax=Chitinophaga sp. TaxID=1869181 RepID=UPI002CAB4CE5|nr:hypothetical protein [Chitinophaga sp.]HVI44345.1 hypothetical protein [Chitinophaga sp.]
MRRIAIPTLVLLYTACNPSAKKEGNTAQQNDSNITQVTPTQVPAASGDTGTLAFGFSNEKGNMIAVSMEDTLKDATIFTYTISAKGELIPGIKFLKRKQEGKDENGRQMAHNFNNADGYIFASTGGNIDADETAVLLSKDFMTKRKFLPLKGIAGDSVPVTIKAMVEKDKQRSIKRYKLLSRVDGKSNIALFEFEGKEGSMLAALAFISDGKAIYYDYPAQYDDMSTWSVDDGGEFGLDYYKILAAFDNNGHIELVTDWYDTEGANAYFLREEDGKFKVVKQGYRYMAPL